MASVGPGVKKLCIDENHGAKKHYDVGGPLYLASVRAPVQLHASGSYLSGPGMLQPGAATHNGFDGSDWRIRYNGSFQLSTDHWGGWLAEEAWPKDVVHPQLNPDNMSDLGSRAYARLRPKIAHASAFQTLAEASDIPKTLKTSLAPFANTWKDLVSSSKSGFSSASAKKAELKRMVRSPKPISNQFLNTVFGWAPLVDDVSKMCEVVLNYSDFVADATRKNGRWQRRKFKEEVVEFEEVLSSQTGTSNFSTPYMTTGWIVPQSGRLQLVRQTVTQVWYEGSFKQYYPEFDESLMGDKSAIASVAQAIRLSGLEINPVNVYKVLPYSWLLDWATNVGDNIQLIHDMASDAVVSRYFYLMRRTVHRFVYRVSFSFVSGGSISYEAVAGHEIKRREVGQNAFGFTALPGGLSGMKLSILAALGFSRGK